MTVVCGKHKTLTLAEKLSLLQDTDKKSESKGKLALKYDIQNSSLSSILKNHQKTEESTYNFKGSSTHQRSWSTECKELKGKLYEIYSQTCAANTPITGPLKSVKRLTSFHNTLHNNNKKKKLSLQFRIN
jgi:hypothetical protein